MHYHSMMLPHEGRVKERRNKTSLQNNDEYILHKSEIPLYMPPV